MSDLNLTSFNPLYPMRIHQYNELINDQNMNVMDKINSIIDYLNQVGKLTNDVVKDWNTVYQWTMNDGLTTDVNNKMEQMLANGEFNTLFNSIIGDMTTLTTPQKDKIVSSLNSVQAEIGDLTTLQTTDKGSLVAAINDNVASLAQIATNVKSYGAKGDGITDDTQAFLNAISACPTGGVLFIPQGTYVISQTLTVNKQMKIQGSSVQDDTQNSIPLTGSILNFKATTAISVGLKLQADGIEIENLFVNNLSSPATNVNVGIQINPVFGGVVWNIHLKRVYVKGFGQHGIYAQGLLVSTFDHVFSSGNQNGFYFDNTSTNGTSLVLNNCWALNNTQYGYFFYTYYYLTLNACAADGNQIGYYFNNCKSVSLQGCGAENSTKEHIYLISSEDMTFISFFGHQANSSNTADAGCSFLAGNSTCKNITLIGCKDNLPLHGTYSASVGSGVMTIINCDFPLPVVQQSVAKTLNVDSTYIINTPFQAPIPQNATAGAMGNWQAINVASGAGYTLPAGGTWLYYFTIFNSGAFSSIASNLAAGGTLLINGSAGQTAAGFCWRIT